MATWWEMYRKTFADLAANLLVLICVVQWYYMIHDPHLL